jgi:Lrp/AsnC family transcriptional regulator for asnA, asnC and gidA
LGFNEIRNSVIIFVEVSNMLDNIDKKIIDALKLDGRTSNAKIARSLSVSEGTVRRRIKKMTSDGVISVYAVPDPKKTGYFAEALIGIQVEAGRLTEVASKISEHKYTTWVANTTGSYDIFTWVTLPTSLELGKFLSNELGKIEGVNKTETFVNLEVLKRGI